MRSTDVEFTDERLPNGLRFILAPDHLAPLVGVNIYYDVGSRNEREGRTGLAHLFEHLMFEGSAHVARNEHNALIEAAGGYSNASTWWDSTRYFENAPAHQLELLLWLEADRLATLPAALTQACLDNQRAVVQNEKRQSYDNRPYGDWVMRLQANLFDPDSPYHHPTIGSMADLDAASLADVVAFFHTHYTPNNAVLAVTGDFEPPAARAAIIRYFGQIPAVPLAAAPSAHVIDLTRGERRELIRAAVPLAKLYVAFHVPSYGDSRYEALDLATGILAGGQGGRMQRRLVRETGLAQDLECYVVGFARAAMLVAEVTARPGVEPATLEAAIHEEFARLGREPVSADELTRVKAMNETRELEALSATAERADRLAMFATFLDDPGFINASAGRYAAVSAADLMGAAGRYLVSDNRVVLTYEPQIR
jgi:predicted Zn-dependent peptidase